MHVLTARPWCACAAARNRPPNHAPAGCLCKKTLGTAGGGLVHMVWMELGPDVTRSTINNIQFTVNHWLLQHGMSIGIGDTVADAATGSKIGAIIDAAKEDVKRIIEQYQVRARVCAWVCLCACVCMCVCVLRWVQGVQAHACVGTPPHTHTCGRHFPHLALCTCLPAHAHRCRARRWHRHHRRRASWSRSPGAR
jgi:hypothetical protein